MVFAPTREDISGWVSEVVWGMDGKAILRNAWRKTGYDWFPAEGGVGGAVVSDDDDDDMVVDDDKAGAGSNDEGDELDDLEDIFGFILGTDKDDEDDGENAEGMA